MHYYPDAFAGWNAVASAGSWITVVSVVVFLYVCFDLLTTDRKFTSWKNELYQSVSDSSVFKPSDAVARFPLWGILGGVTALCISTEKMHADSPEAWHCRFQDPASPIMKGIIERHHDRFFIMIAVTILVVWVLFRTVYLHHSGRSDLATTVIDHSTSSVVEVVWTILPAVVLLFVAVPSFSLLYSLDDLVDPALTLKVVGRQWFWTYGYSNFLLTSTESLPATFEFDSYMIPEEDLERGQFRRLEVDNRVVLPAHTHIRRLITAGDVLHSFAVPSLGVKADAVPGRLNQASLFIDRPGVYYGACSEICGIQHGFMPIVVEAVDFNLFTNWVWLKSHEV